MLFNLAQSFRPLTMSTAANAVAQARLLAQCHLAAGGAPAPTGGRVDDDATADFVIPADVDPAVVAVAIRAKLGGEGLQAGLGEDMLHPLERVAGGRVAMPGRHLLRLGDGHYERGKRFMHGVVARVRATRRVRGKR